MARKYHQGKFVPKNPKKYRGDVLKIFYRSSWELRFMKELDDNSNIIAWNSEEVVIPYISPIDGKQHRYFTDFVLLRKTKDGKEQVYLVEIKPFAQTVPPEKKNKKTKTFISEVMTYGVNQAKWDAAKIYCAKRGWKFQIITEKEMKGLLMKS